MIPEYSGGLAKIPSAIVGGFVPNVFGRRAATTKQGVAEKFGGEKDVGYLSRYVAESSDKKHPASSQGWRSDVLQVPRYSKTFGG